MKLDNATFQNSQINENTAGDNNAEFNNFGAIENSGSGQTFVNCVFGSDSNPIGMLDGFREAQSKLLQKAQHEILHNRLDESHLLFQTLIEPKVFETLGNDDKKITLHNYCSLCVSLGKQDEAQSWISSLKNEFKEHYIVMGWAAWFEYQSGSQSALEKLSALLTIHSDSPVLLDLSLRCSATDIYQRAKSFISDLIAGSSFSSIDEKYRSVLVTFAVLSGNAGEVGLASDAINLVEPKDDLEKLNLEIVTLKIKAQGILLHDHIAHQHHMTVAEWESLYLLEEQVNSLFLEANRLSVEKDDLYMLRALIYSLREEYVEATKSVPTHILKKVDTSHLIVLINCYQALGDWHGILSLLDNVGEQQKQELVEVHAIALVNLGRSSEALKLEGIPEYIERIVLDEGADSAAKTIELKDVGDFSISSQVAFKRYRDCKDESALEFLQDYCPETTHEKFLKAKYLYLSDALDSAFEILQELFKELGGGIGRPFTLYIDMLMERECRREVSDLFKSIPESMIHSNRRLLFSFINFILATKGPNQVLKILEKAITHEQKLWLKVEWLKQAHELGRRDEIIQKLEFWGLEHDGHPEEIGAFLNIASDFCELRKVLRLLYRLYHENPRSLSILQNAFAVYHRKLIRGALDEPLSCTEVTSSTFIILSNETIDRPILIDDSLSDTGSTFFYTSDDEIVAGLIGAKLGETVTFENAEWTVKSISEPMNWLIYHASTELPKRPKLTQIVQFNAGSAEDNVSELLKHINNANAEKEKALHDVTAGDGFIVRRYIGAPQNLITGWLDILCSKYSQEQNIPFSPRRALDLKGLDGYEVILDPTAAVSLFIATDIISILDECSLNIGTTHSLSAVFRNEIRTQGPLPIYRADWDEEIANWVCPVSEENDSIIERCESFVQSVENGVIKEFDPIPSKDITGKYLELVSLLDEETKGSIFACYGDDNRILVSDDPAVYTMCSLLGVSCLSSFEFLYCMPPTQSGDYKIEEAIFLMSRTKMVSPIIPVRTFNFIFKAGIPNKDIDDFLDKHLLNLEFTTANLRIILILASCRFDSVFHQNTVDYVCEQLIKRLHNPTNTDILVHCFLCIIDQLQLPSAWSDHLSLKLMKWLGIDVQSWGPLSNEMLIGIIKNKYLKADFLF